MTAFLSVGLNKISFLLVISITCLITGMNSSNKHAHTIPDDPLSTFQLEPGFKIELIASEPLIADPVDMEIDEFGRLYVVEMHGYPLDKSGSGKIKLVSDSDGDGSLDKSIVFADGLILPNSIMRWKKGVIVTDAPNVLYLEDTNDDGRADIRDTMLTGFALSNPQHNLNSPVLGIDNWIYLAHESAVTTQIYTEEFGDPGSEVFYPGHPGTPRLKKNASGRSVRFRPDHYLLETTSANTQFGHSFDKWGHRFLVSNANHILHEVVATSYLKRNPELLISNATQSLSDHKNAAEVFPITRQPEYQLLTDVGVITSACGLTNYLGGAFPPPFDQVSFVAEPVSNLVHADIIKENGASFTASRMHAAKEFLASTDSWFRPVNMYVGPDGALYVVDYYRQIIEHPEWMGEEVVKSGKLYNGTDKGRIYRITPKEAGPAAWMKGLPLGNATDESLVNELANPNYWWRLNAQRLLVDHANSRMLPLLIQVAEKNPFAPGRLHAMWTLEGLGHLNSAVIRHALKDPVAGIRENAIKLAELHFDDMPDLQDALLSLKGDPDAKVRYQLLSSLGSVQTAPAAAARKDLLFRDIHDEWVQVAALSAPPAGAPALLHAVIDSFKNNVPAYTALARRLGTMVAAGQQQEIIHQLIVDAVTPVKTKNNGWQGALLAGIGEGLRGQPTKAVYRRAQKLLIKNIFSNPSKQVREGALDLLKTIGLNNDASVQAARQKAAVIAASRQQPAHRRVEAIKFIALGDPAPYADMLQKLISPAEESIIQVAALQTLSAVPGNRVAAFILVKWPDLTPAVRNEAINSFMAGSGRIAILLDAIEAGRIQASAIGWPRTVRLMAQQDLKLRERARTLLTKDQGEQLKVNRAYQDVLALKGVPDKGKVLFHTSCSPCHQVRGESGFHFGPDLGTIHNWSAEAIMASILAPDLSISSGYDLWTIDLKDGSSFQGIIASETPSVITVKNAGREERTIKRADIRSIKALKMSAMPVGFEKQISRQQMADLLAFLKENK